MPISARTSARLVAIGGGAIPEEISAEIVRLGGGEEARIVVCPLASDDPTTGEFIAEHRFRARHSLRNVSVFDLLSPEKYRNEEGSKRPFFSEMRAFANSTESLRILDEADVFYFSGGDQRTILATLHETLFARRLMERWRAGQTVVAGTSAGLQVQSELALTGDFRFEGADECADASDTPCPIIGRGIVETAPGLGFLKGVIFDQHFLARRRQNRLISAVLDHPEFLGVGVDESTALIFDGAAGEQVLPQVVGRSGVFVVDASRATLESDSHGRLAKVDGLQCGIAWAGSAFPRALRLAW